MMKRWHFHNLNREFWFNAIRTVVPHVPGFVLSPIRFFISALCFLALSKERRASLSNLKRITGKNLLVCIWYNILLLDNYAKQLVIFVLHDSYPDDYWNGKVKQDLTQVAKITTALERGKGLILISAHLGSWEMGKHVLAIRKERVNMVMVPAEDNAMEEHWNKFRARSGLNIINLKASPFASLEIINALRNNEIVAIHGDRIASQAAVHVEFFGEPVPFPSGPIELARITGAPVLGAYIIIDKDGYFHVEVDDTLELNWTGDRKKDVPLNVQKMAKMLEKYVRKYPTQWYAFYDFWNQNIEGVQ